mgnify:CR=1 FL=1
MDIKKSKIAIIGLGYVGLPLAIEFSKKQKCFISGKILNRKIIGFDINLERIEELKKGLDNNPSSISILSNIGYILQGFKQHKDAIKYYKRALNLNPEEEESTPGRKDLSLVRGYLSQLQSSEINLGILIAHKKYTTK